MKKLMIAAAIVCAAAVSHGALAQWGMKSGEVAGPVGGANTDEYGYLAAGTIFLYVGDYVTASASAFNFGSADFITTGGLTEAFNWGSPDATASLAKLGSTSADQKFSLILVDQDGLNASDLAKYEGNYILYTGTSTEGSIPDPLGGPSTPYAMFLDQGSTYAGDWKTMSAVPEPTSGLLLLLGVAGLALKRKRA